MYFARYLQDNMINSILISFFPSKRGNTAIFLFLPVQRMAIMDQFFPKGAFAMLKMLATQLTGVFSKIQEKEEFSLEDGARLLAQAAVGEGTIYIKGFQEMEGVVSEALSGAEPLGNAKMLERVAELSHTDRVLLFARLSDDPDAVALGRTLVSIGVPFVSVAGTKQDAENDLTQLADVHINTQIVKPLLPTEDGRRTCFPSLIAALFAYFGLKFIIDEILQEYE
jgi:hypothetical protein